MEITIQKGWGEKAQTFKGELSNRQKPKTILKQSGVEYFLSDKTFYIDSDSLKIRYTTMSKGSYSMFRNLYVKVLGVFVFVRRVDTELTQLDNDNVNSVKSIIENIILQMSEKGFKEKQNNYFSKTFQTN
jgi:hypothetical protein